MRVVCLQENLAKGLAVVSRAISSRVTLPILQNVLLKAEAPATLRLSATNLDLAINCWIAAQVEEEGATTVPARLLTDFVNTLPSGPVRMELSVRTQSFHLIADRTEADFRVIDAADFPVIPTAEENDTITLAPAALRHMIQQVTFAASTDESRPTLTGVYITTEDGRLVFVATDGYRLALRSTPVDRVPHDLGVIVPARSLNEVSRIAADADEEGEAAITITGERNQVVFRIPGLGTRDTKGAFLRAEIISQIIDATYPKYKGIIPTTWKTRTILNTQESPRPSDGPTCLPRKRPTSCASTSSQATQAPCTSTPVPPNTANTTRNWTRSSRASPSRCPSTGGICWTCCRSWTCPRWCWKPPSPPVLAFYVP